ncbi:MAG: amidohydrolase family protein [Anaerolineae bacterium]
MTELHADLVIEGQLLIDGLGGPPISPGLAAITGRRVVYAGSALAAPPFLGARRIDLGEACLLPGLIDMHVHPTYYWEEPDSATYTYEPEGSLVYSPVLIALLAASNLREALMAGVTTARDTGSVDEIMFDVKRAVEKGWIPGPRLYVAGRLIVPTGGHVHYLPGLANQADGPYGFRRAVREEVRAGADFIKIANNGEDLTQEELNAAVDEAHRLGKKVACHTSKPPSQRMAIEAGVDTFEHGTPMPEEIDLAVEKGITWIPTLNISQEYLKWCESRWKTAEEEPVGKGKWREVEREKWRREWEETSGYLDRKRASMEYALRAGLKLAVGTDSWMGKVRFGAIADELCWLVEYGCSPMQAIQAATAWPAQAMGWSEIGTLEPGKLADLIAVGGNPLTNMRVMEKVVLVMREGEVLKIPPSGAIGLVGSEEFSSV